MTLQATLVHGVTLYYLVKVKGEYGVYEARNYRMGGKHRVALHGPTGEVLTGGVSGDVERAMVRHAQKQGGK